MNQKALSKAIKNNQQMIINGINKIYKNNDKSALLHQNLSSLPILRLLGNISSIARDHNLNKFNTILEVGCGHGHITKWLRAMSEDVVAFDASVEAIEAAKKQSSYPEIFFVGDGIDPASFIKKKFDLIIISEFHPFKRSILDNGSTDDYDSFYSEVIEAYIKLLDKNGLLVVAHEIANIKQRLNRQNLKISLPVHYFSPRKFAIEDIFIFRPIANIFNWLLKVMLMKKYANFYIINIA